MHRLLGIVVTALALVLTTSPQAVPAPAPLGARSASSTGLLLLVSRSVGGGPATGDSAPLAITPSGRYTLFTSTAADVVDGFAPDTSRGATGLYRWDRHDDLVRAVGVLPSASSAVISDDGRTVAVTGDKNTVVIDLRTRRRDHLPFMTGQTATLLQVSDGGRFITFVGLRYAFPGYDDTAGPAVLVWDRRGDHVRTIATPPDPSTALVSHDRRYVTWTDSHGVQTLDRTTGGTTTVTASGGEAVMSPSGRYLVYAVGISADGYLNDLHRWDRTTGRTLAAPLDGASNHTPQAVGDDGEVGFVGRQHTSSESTQETRDLEIWRPAARPTSVVAHQVDPGYGSVSMVMDGRGRAAIGAPTGLTAEDDDQRPDVYLWAPKEPADPPAVVTLQAPPSRARPDRPFHLRGTVRPAGGGTVIVQAQGFRGGFADVASGRAAADGTFDVVVPLEPGTAGYRVVRPRSRTRSAGASSVAVVTAVVDPDHTGDVRLASASNRGGIADGPSELVGLSDDGRYVVLSSTARDLTPAGDADDHEDNDLFLRDLVTGRTLDLTAAGTSSDRVLPVCDPCSDHVTMAGDAHTIAYMSDLSGLTDDDVDHTAKTFVWHDGVTTMVPGAVVPSLSHDGRWLAFDDAGGLELRDLTTGATSTVVASAGPPAFQTAIQTVITADGSAIAFTSNHDPLTGEDRQVADVYVWHRLTGLVTRVSDDQGGYDPRVSDDGDLVSYRSGSGIVLWSALTGARAVVTSEGCLTGGGVTPDGSRVAVDGCGYLVDPVTGDRTQVVRRPSGVAVPGTVVPTRDPHVVGFSTRREGIVPYDTGLGFGRGHGEAFVRVTPA